MGGGRHGAHLGASGLDHHHRFDLGGLLQHIDQLVAVLDALDVHQDNPAVLVGGQVPQQVGLVEIGLVAHRDDGRQPDVFHRRFADHGQPQGAALGDDGHVARQHLPGAEGGVDRRHGGVDAEDIGSQDAHAVIPGDLDDLALLLDIAHLGEPRGDQHQKFNPFAAAVLHRLENMFGRDGQHGHVHRSVDLVQRGIHRQAEDLAAARVDRIDPAGILAELDVLDDFVSDFILFMGGPDHGHRSGLKQEADIRSVFFHPVSRKVILSSKTP